MADPRSVAESFVTRAIRFEPIPGMDRFDPAHDIVLALGRHDEDPDFHKNRAKLIAAIPCRVDEHCGRDA